MENDPGASRYIFFGGKGGVGKTTAASATALFLLNQLKRNDSILLFSTDPAHSLSDSLDIKIGNRLVEVKQLRGARLVAYEMDASLALERFREAHGKVLAEIAERGTLLDEEDINELLSLSLPGLDEVMSLFELSELDRAGQVCAHRCRYGAVRPHFTFTAIAGSFRSHGESARSDGRQTSLHRRPFCAPQTGRR